MFLGQYDPLVGIFDGRSDLIIDDNVIDATEQLDQRLQRQGRRVDSVNGIATNEVVHLPGTGFNRGVRGDRTVQ